MTSKAPQFLFYNPVGFLRILPKWHEDTGHCAAAHKYLDQFPSTCSERFMQFLASCSKRFSLRK